MASFDLDTVNQQLANDPQWQALVQKWKQSGVRFMGKGNTAQYSQGLQPFRDYLKTKGIDLPNDVSLDPVTGSFDQGWTNSTGGAAALSALEFAGMAAGAYGVGALGSGAAVTPTTAGASGAAATGTGAAAAPVVAGAGTASTVAPVVAGAAGPAGASLWSKIAAPLVTTGINAAAGYAGTKLQVDANKEAAAVQAKYLQDALDWQKAQLAQRRTDLSPAINTGNAATYKLGDLMGLPATSGPYAPPTPAHQDLGLPTTSTGPANNWSPSTPPSPVQPGTAATGNQGPTVNGQPQMVAMRSPNGTVGYVPAGRVNDALAAGGQRV